MSTSTTITQLNNQLANLTAQFKGCKPVTIAPHVMEALTDPDHPFHPNRQEAPVQTIPAEQFDALQRELDKPATADPKLVELFNRPSPFADEEPEHDWAAYDSSDIHQRTEEWESQIQPTVIQHFVPKSKKLTITATQREHANAALTVAMPGVQLSATLRQRKAHQLLVEFLGLDAANRIMAGE